MKSLIIATILTCTLNVNSALSSDGDGGGGGPKMSADANVIMGEGSSSGGGPRISLEDIQSIETVDRRIIFKEDIRIIFKVDNEKLLLDERILNIESSNGEMINIH